MEELRNLSKLMKMGNDLKLNPSKKSAINDALSKEGSTLVRSERVKPEEIEGESPGSKKELSSELPRKVSSWTDNPYFNKKAEPIAEVSKEELRASFKIAESILIAREKFDASRNDIQKQLTPPVSPLKASHAQESYAFAKPLVASKSLERLSPPQTPRTLARKNSSVQDGASTSRGRRLNMDDAHTPGL